MNIGLIGCGAIGDFLIRHLNRENSESTVRITAILDERNNSNSRLENYQTMYGTSIHNNFSGFINSNLDVVVEAANINVVKKYAEKVIRSKKIFMPISIGAFADLDFFHSMSNLAEENNTEIIFPSGAIAGLDGIKAAASLGTLEFVELITTKPAYSLDEVNLQKEKVIYSGSAREAISKYPSNTNVSILLSLAGIGVENTNVTIIADPSATENIHQVKAAGAFGEFMFQITNKPLPSNPKTSYLTVLSIISALEQLTVPVKIG